MNYRRNASVQFGEYEALETFDRAYARASRQATSAFQAAARSAGAGTPPSRHAPMRPVPEQAPVGGTAVAVHA